VTRIEVFPAADGWRFRVRAANGRITAQSEGYTRYWSALRGAKQFRASLRDAFAPIWVMDR
jgi:uncharacterized protein YegP (UPF0339 family)